MGTQISSLTISKRLLLNLKTDLIHSFQIFLYLYLWDSVCNSRNFQICLIPSILVLHPPLKFFYSQLVCNFFYHSPSRVSPVTTFISSQRSPTFGVFPLCINIRYHRRMHSAHYSRLQDSTDSRYIYSSGNGRNSPGHTPELGQNPLCKYKHTYIHNVIHTYTYNTYINTYVQCMHAFIRT